MKRKITLVIAFVLVLCAGIGGTMAWLSATSDKVVNTFTVGDINISLTETTGTFNGINTRSFDFVPGDEIAKDPKVTVEADSEACYLFVRVIESNNTFGSSNAPIVNWEVDESVWTPLNGHAGYWYKEISDSTANAGVSYYVLEGTNAMPNGRVTISTDITKDLVNSINAAKPTITVQAAAIQSANVGDVLNAWTNLPDDFKN